MISSKKKVKAEAWEEAAIDAVNTLVHKIWKVREVKLSEARKIALIHINATAQETK